MSQLAGLLIIFGLLGVARASAAPELRASPPIINYGGIYGVTWNGAPGQNGDWIGLYTVGAPDSSPWLWVGAAAHSYTWTLPAVVPPGANYEFRMFCCHSFTRLGTSNHVWVQDPNVTAPVPTPEPAPDSTSVLHDYSNTTWQPGPMISGRNWSTPGAPEFDGVTFSAGGNVDYVTTPAQGPLPYSGKIRFRFRLHGGPLRGQVDGGSSGVFLHFQRAGDTWSGQGAYNCYRLWNNRDVSLTGRVGGDYELDAILTEQHWGGVLSGCSQSEFMAALAHVDKVGWTHLDSQSKGHGNTGNGARIEVLEYKVVQ
jgi:hypothetical protein